MNVREKIRELERESLKRYRPNPDLSRKFLNEAYNMLPRGCQILWLSHSGSRAYGWGTDYVDWDIHGVMCCKNYFDWAHAGYSCDLNLYEVYHLVNMDIEYKHGETLVNLLNPFFIRDNIPFFDLVNSLGKDYWPPSNLESEINRLEYNFSCRTALHTYRMFYVPTNILLGYPVHLNVYTLALRLEKDINFLPEGIVRCTYAYRRHNQGLEEKNVVLQELYTLLDIYKSMWNNWRETDKTRLEKFKDSLLSYQGKYCSSWRR